MEILIVTGLSGAGKSHAMKSLEDSGYYCVDNIPPILIPRFVELCSSSMDEIERAALVVDIRGGSFFDDLFEALDELKKRSLTYRILFLEAKNEALIKRFKETRRQHPMQGNGSIVDGIVKEREKLKTLKERADTILDTSDLNTNQLKNEVRKIFYHGETGSSITVSVTSFGFKKGILLDADLIFDVRFLPNPYYIEELRELTGNDQRIQEYVMQWDEAKVFRDKLFDMINFLIPQYIKEGKNQLVIGIGCTGGKHRSVTMANKLYEELGKNHRVTIKHRDIIKAIND